MAGVGGAAVVRMGSSAAAAGCDLGFCCGAPAVRVAGDGFGAGTGFACPCFGSLLNPIRREKRLKAPSDSGATDCDTGFDSAEARLTRDVLDVLDVLAATDPVLAGSARGGLT